MGDGFISEEDLRTLEGWLKYQGVDPATITPGEQKMWQGLFEEAMKASDANPKVGLMKLQRVPGEQKYAVAIKDGPDLWLTMWARCSRKGEIFIMYPRGDRDWDAHASYHRDGTLHQKSRGTVLLSQKRQPLTAAFRGSEHIGAYKGHGTRAGAVCDPKVFDGVIRVEPRILGPIHGSVAFDLVEPGYEPKPDHRVLQRQVFRRGTRPSVIITILPETQSQVFLNWPDDFGRAA
jgi:hypothetical protein